MSLAQQYDIGRYVRSEIALAAVTQNSDTTDDADTESGISIDRQALTQHFYSAQAVLGCTYTGTTASKNVALALSAQHSSDGTSWDSYSTATNGSATISTTGTTAVNGEAIMRLNLRGARRYVRIQASADFSATSSAETAALMGFLVFGGPDTLPSS